MKIYRSDKVVFHSNSTGDFLPTINEYLINNRQHWKLSELITRLQQYIDNNPNYTVLVTSDGGYDWSELVCVLERDETQTEKAERQKKEQLEQEEKRKQKEKEVAKLKKRLKQLEEEII